MAELSVYRSENKYLLTCTEALSLMARLDKLLSRDEFSAEDKYSVRSLYFDSMDNCDYLEKTAGTEVRKKIRIRSYSPQDKTCKLEVKHKNGDLQHKVSLIITKEDALSLINCDYGVLIKYFDEYKDAAFIYSTMLMGHYRPVALIEYDRLAYMHPLYSTRITFDMNVRSSETNFNLFDEAPMYTPVFNEMTILEVKFNGILLESISKALAPYNLTRTSVSKYCMGRKTYLDFEF